MPSGKRLLHSVSGRHNDVIVTDIAEVHADIARSFFLSLNPCYLNLFPCVYGEKEQGPRRVNHKMCE